MNEDEIKELVTIMVPFLLKQFIWIARVNPEEADNRIQQVILNTINDINKQNIASVGL